MQRFALSLALLAAASAYGFSPLRESPLSFRAAAGKPAGSEPDSTSAHKSNAGTSQLRVPTDRRTSLARIAALTAAPLIPLVPRPAHAADVAPPPPSSLEARSADNSLAPPAYGMEAPDIFYPPAFAGSWKVVSRTVDIVAPCGFELFTGGRAAYDNAVKTEISERSDLEYRARFVVPPSGGEDVGGARLVADREYNAREIAKAAMGLYSIVDTPLATPNRYSCLLAPPGGATDLVCVDILTIARRVEPEAATPGKFVCSEFVRQIVSPSRRNNPNALPVSPLSVKEVETISIYSEIDKDTIKCRQRTASFLVPSQTDPMAFKKWQMSQGRPVDVRYYDVTFTRI